MKKAKTKALIALIMVVFIWGFDFIALDYMTEYISATLITVIRLWVSAIIMIIYIFAKEKGLHIDKADWPRVFICGAIGMSIYLSLEALGIERTSGSLASLILATVPVFGVIADRILYGSKITIIKVAGIIGSIIGVALLVSGSGDAMKGSIIGVVIMFVAAILWTFFIVYTKPLYEKYSLPTILTGLFASGAVTGIPLVFIMDHPIRFEPNTATLFWLVLTSIVCILIGEFLYVNAIGNLSVTIVSLSENVLPLVTVIFSWVIFGVMLTPIQLIGGAVIIISVSIITAKE